MAAGTAKRYVILGLLLYALFLLFQAPASLLAWLLPAANAERLRLDETQGTLWHGMAGHLQLQMAPDRVIDLGRLTWNVRWNTLLRGEIAYALDLAAGPAQARGIVGLGLGKWRVEDVEATFPAELMIPFAPLLQVVRPSGTIRIHSNSFTLARNGAAGEVQLTWLGASAILSRENPLGDYTLQVRGTPSGAQLQCDTLSGVLQIKGSGAWDRTGLQFHGSAQTQPTNREALVDLLRLIGQDEGNGVYRLTYGHP